MNAPDAPIAHEGFFATYFFTVSDQDKSKDFYVRILGGKVIKPCSPCYINLANTWIILNSGGGPTPDKPEVLLETPSDLNRVNSFLDLRVADIWACYKQWGDKGAFFLTEPLDNHGWEWRCYMRDPDGYLIEVGQYTEIAHSCFMPEAYGFLHPASPENRSKRRKPPPAHLIRRYRRYYGPIVLLPSRLA